MKTIKSRRLRFGKLAAIATASAALSACAVTPRPMTGVELETRARDVRVAVTAAQEPIAGPIDLYEAMARALKYNLDYKVEQLNQALRDRELTLSTYDMLPQLVANASYYGRSNQSGASSLSLLTNRQSLEPSTSSERNVFSGDLTLSWDILDFGLSYIRAQQRADQVLIAAEERRKVSNRIIEDVRTAYWRAVSAQRLLDQLGQLRSAITATLNNSEQLAQRRTSAPLVALTYQRELIDIEANIIALTRELQLARTQLAALMNVEPGTDYALVMPPRETALPTVNIPADEQVMIALRNRPELRQVGYRQHINRRELDAQLLSAFPNLRAFIGINADSNDFLYNSSWAQYGARSAFNLMNVFRLPAARRSVQAQDDVLRAQELATAMAVMTQVHVARARYNIYSTALDTARRSHDVQTRIMGQIDGGFRAGATSRQTLLREQMNSLVSEVRYDIAYADAQNAYANLYAAMGIDSFTPEVTDAQSVAQLAASLRDLWAQRDVAVVR